MQPLLCPRCSPHATALLTQLLHRVLGSLRVRVFFFLSAGPWARNAGGCRACVVVWRWRGFCCARAGPSGAHRGRALGVAGPDRCGGGLCGHGASRRGERGGATKYVPGPPKYVPPPSKGQTKHVHFSRKMYGENEFAHVSWSCPWIGRALGHGRVWGSTPGVGALFVARPHSGSGCTRGEPVAGAKWWCRRGLCAPAERALVGTAVGGKTCTRPEKAAPNARRAAKSAQKSCTRNFRIALDFWPGCRIRVVPVCIP